MCISICRDKGGNTLTDQEIVQLLSNRDEVGLAHLAKKYERLVLHIVKTILGTNINDIEECINDTYLRVWINIDRFDFEKASFKTYLKVIARNMAINKLRTVAKKESKIIPLDYSEAAQDYIEEKHNVEGTVILKEDVKRLNHIIVNLKKKDKEIAIRKFFYLQSSKDIAKAMNMTVTAIDSRISRLRSKIQEEFKKE